MQKRIMPDTPVRVLIFAIWAYWVGVGVMVTYVQRKTRKAPGLLPKLRLERVLWLIWTPVVISWLALPSLAAIQAHSLFTVPRFATTDPVLCTLRWVAAFLSVLCVILTIECWIRMGVNWRVAVVPGEKTNLVTSGFYAHIRHPIYAMSILLMLCSAVIVPTVPMFTVAIIHVVLMSLKARNEERFLSQTHGKLYEKYSQRTGRFFPRLTSRKS